jgi:hypothetical protein
MASIVLVMACAAAARADVTITSTMSSKGPGMGIGGDVVTFIKGTKMRTDMTMRGQTRTTIVDLEAHALVSVNHETKQALRYDMRSYAPDLARVGQAGVAVDLKPTGETKTLLGQACDGYAITVSTVAFSTGRGGLDKTRMVMSGPAWIASASPGRADYEVFYGTAASMGLVFTDPRTVRAQPGQAKGLAALYAAIAAKGVPYWLEVTVTHEGIPAQGDVTLHGQPLPPGAPSRPLLSASTSSVVTGVSTDPIQDSVFEVPEGYKASPAGR